jgi:hypothetical protein
LEGEGQDGAPSWRVQPVFQQAAKQENYDFLKVAEGRFSAVSALLE